MFCFQTTTDIRVWRVCFLWYQCKLFFFKPFFFHFTSSAQIYSAKFRIRVPYKVFKCEYMVIDLYLNSWIKLHVFFKDNALVKGSQSVKMNRRLYPLKLWNWLYLFYFFRVRFCFMKWPGWCQKIPMIYYGK